MGNAGEFVAFSRIAFGSNRHLVKIFLRDETLVNQSSGWIGHPPIVLGKLKEGIEWI